MLSESRGARIGRDLEEALRGLMTQQMFREGATLFCEGTIAEGLRFVEAGAVRLLLPAGGNQLQLLEVARAGALLGLSESLSEETYRVTAVACEQTTVSFIARKDFIEFLGGHHEFCIQIVRLLSENLHGLYHKFRSVSAHPGRPRRRLLNEQLH